MNNQITTYYIPNNPNIPKGHIYTLYLNNNTNLELSSILNTKSLQLNTLISPTEKAPSPAENTITISQEDYTRLLELNNLAYQLSTKRTKDIQSFIATETKTTTELSKINTERQELIKKLTKGSGVKSWMT